jgi:hypothetical protein
MKELNIFIIKLYMCIAVGAILGIIVTVIQDMS